MAIHGLPPDKPVVGRIEIVLYVDEGGLGTAFGYEGISKESAIGHMTVVQDRLREERRLEWETCPECHRPWSEHETEDE